MKKNNTGGKSLIFVIRVQEREEKECGAEKIFEEIIAEMLKFDGIHKATSAKSSVNPKQDKTLKKKPSQATS